MVQKFLDNKKSIIVYSLIALTIITGIAINSISDYFGRENAKELLHLLYDFGNVNELDKRYKDVEEITNKEVYNKVTSLDRTLRAYLKMEGKASTLKILRAEDGYIVYELQCEALTSGRKFIVLYETNFRGIITDFKEMEIVSFI